MTQARNLGKKSEIKLNTLITELAGLDLQGYIRAREAELEDAKKSRELIQDQRELNEKIKSLEESIQRMKENLISMEDEISNIRIKYSAELKKIQTRTTILKGKLEEFIPQIDDHQLPANSIYGQLHNDVQKVNEEIETASRNWLTDNAFDETVEKLKINL